MAPLYASPVSPGVWSMFPLRDDNPHFLTPWVTYTIIGLNVLAWVFLQ